MTKKKVLSAIILGTLLFVGFAFGANLNIRTIERIVDVDNPSYSKEPDTIYAYQDESVIYKIFPYMNGKPVEIPNGCVAEWKLDNQTTNALTAFGITTNNSVLFEIPAGSFAGLNTYTEYHSFAKVVDGDAELNVADETYLQILYSPKFETNATPVITNEMIASRQWVSDNFVSSQGGGLDGYVPTNRTINNYPLSENITLTAEDVGALPLDGDGGTVDGDILFTGNVVFSNLPKVYWEGLEVVAVRSEIAGLSGRIAFCETNHLDRIRTLETNVNNLNNLTNTINAVDAKVLAVSNRVDNIENTLGNYATIADIQSTIKEMITDGGIIIGDWEYKLVVEKIRNLAYSVIKFSDGTSITTNIVGTMPATYYLDTTLTSIELGKNVTGIAGNAFKGCSNLTNIVLPNTISSLVGRPGGQFQASGITSIRFPTSLTSIPAVCCDSCPNLKTVYIPASVTSIGGGAFSYCSSLKDVYFEGKTKAQVQAMYNYNLWFLYDSNFVIHCTDGDIQK